ncbi:MAG: SGNH/GDSL hydrolase family protein [Solirubrobacteraceae bacterium]
MRRYVRFVAMGDSTAEGLDDPDGAGGYRGWADRLAERLAAIDPATRYANLAVRGRLIAQVREEQLGPALALEPDLVVMSAGVNDLLRPGFDPTRVMGNLEAMQRELIGTGATVVCFTMPDLSAFMPVARLVRARLLAHNAALLELGARTGAIVVDLASSPVAGDSRFWSDDRLHANTLGHERMELAFAAALGLLGEDPAPVWLDPLPAAAARRRREAMRAELRWGGRHLAPWVVRRLRGRSSGDGVVAKRPELLPVLHESARPAPDAGRPA